MIEIDAMNIDAMPLAAEMETFLQHEAELQARHKTGLVIMRGNKAPDMQGRMDTLAEDLKAYGDVSFLARDISAGYPA